VIEGQKPAVAAEKVGISLNAVLIAKSRILKQLRRELEGLID
jgi:DNA-directed RNA polymerase specialized sigma24 family protein